MLDLLYLAFLLAPVSVVDPGVIPFLLLKMFACAFGNAEVEVFSGL